MPDIILENLESGKEFRIDFAEDIASNRGRNVISIPLAGNDAQDTVLFPISGKEEDIPLSFVLVDTGVDKANGTHSSQVFTVQEQVEYLRNEIDTPGIDDLIQIQSEPLLGFGNALEGVITQMDISLVSGSTVGTCSMTIKIGKIGLLGGG